MSADANCEEVRGLLPELALGVTEGRERADVLEHLAGCPDCRVELDRLSAVADELLLLAPERQASPGFEARALGAMAGARHRRTFRRALVPALAATLAAALMAGALLLAFEDDRDLASRYRQTLEIADGKYLTAAELREAGGSEAGTVFGYEGSPSWVFVDVQLPPGASADYEVQAFKAEGRPVSLGWMEVSGGEGGEGWTLPGEFHDVTEVRLLGKRRGDSLTAEFGGG
jgi:Putative zinc-finger